MRYILEKDRGYGNGSARITDIAPKKIHLSDVSYHGDNNKIHHLNEIGGTNNFLSGSLSNPHSLNPEPTGNLFAFITRAIFAG